MIFSACISVCNISDVELQTDSPYKYFSIHYILIYDPPLLRELHDGICKSKVDLEVHVRHTFLITISTLSFSDKKFFFNFELFLSFPFSYLLSFGFRTRRIADEFPSHSFVCFESCVWSSC